MPEQPASPWLTVKEAAARARCGPKLIYAAIRRGDLKAASIGCRRDYRLHVEWVDAYLVAAAEPRAVRPSLRQVTR